MKKFMRHLHASLRVSRAQANFDFLAAKSKHYFVKVLALRFGNLSHNLFFLDGKFLQSQQLLNGHGKNPPSFHNPA